VNDRGVRQVFTPVMWKIPVPPRLHIFLWLLANNKVLTRDNLAKRRHLDDKSCLFCNEPETNAHLFFGCCVAQVMWGVIAELFTLPRVKDFESFGKMWLRGKNFKAYNVLYTAVVWSLWKTRNNLCFQGMAWTKVEAVMSRCAGMIRSWAMLSKSEDAERLDGWAKKCKASEPGMATKFRIFGI
jgi:hypothetical protein